MLQRIPSIPHYSQEHAKKSRILPSMHLAGTIVAKLEHQRGYYIIEGRKITIRGIFSQGFLP